MKYSLVLTLVAVVLFIGCQPVSDLESNESSSLVSDSLKVQISPFTLSKTKFKYNFGGKCNVKGTDSHSIRFTLFDGATSGADRPSLFEGKASPCTKGVFSFALKGLVLGNITKLDIKTTVEALVGRENLSATKTITFKDFDP